MKIKFFILVVLTFQYLQSFASKDNDSLIIELSQCLINNDRLTYEKEMLYQLIDEFSEALDLREADTTIIASNVRFDFIRADVRPDVNEIDFIIMITSLDLDKQIQFNIFDMDKGQSFVDINGETYHTNKIEVGGLHLSSPIHKGVTQKVVITFKNIIQFTPYIQELRISGFISGEHLAKGAITIGTENFNVNFAGIKL